MQLGWCKSQLEILAIHPTLTSFRTNCYTSNSRQIVLASTGIRTRKDLTHRPLLLAGGIRTLVALLWSKMWAFGPYKYVEQRVK